MSTRMERVYILGGVRSYIGLENGMYRHLPAERLGAAVLQKVTRPYLGNGIDLVVAGNAVGAGGNIARLAWLEAGLPQGVPAMTVDVQCGSGLESIATAAAKIGSGQADLVIAGGFESSSTAPWRRYHKNHPDYSRYGGENGWYKVAKFIPGEHRDTAMLEGAEQTAQAENIARKDLDYWVLRSHRLAKETREKGILEDVVAEIENGCNRDEGIRDRMSQRLLDRLPCVLPGGKVITAANACLTNDGAAFLVLCSERLAKENGWKPRAEFFAAAQVGNIAGESPRSAVAAIDRLLWRQKLTEKDIDIFECNEAFALIDELFARRYPEAADRYNIFGGALAYGHPYGASGGIIALHAVKALEYTGSHLAVCSIAAAGGVGTALLIGR